MSNVYETNDTMKLLGHQYYDIFVFGYLMGMRAARQQKKQGKQKKKWLY